MNSYYVPDFSVKINGLVLEADVSSAVMSLTYESSLKTAAMFRLQLYNGDMRLTDSALFDVGKAVEIQMGYVGNLHAMMLGEIAAVQPTFPASGVPTLTITGYDKSHALRHNSPARFTFHGMNDSAIAAQIAGENQLIPMVDPAPWPVGCPIQQTGSDWALLQELADRNGFDLYVQWDRLHFQLPRPQTEMVVLEWRKNLSSFTPRLSTSGQAGVAVIRGYDADLAQNIVAVLPTLALGSDLDEIVERLGSQFVDQLSNLGRKAIRTQKVNNHLEAAVLAKTVLKQLLEGLFEGSGSCVGLPQLRAGDLVEIRGVGKRFSGQYRLSSVTHSISESGYTTQFEVSQKSGATLLERLRKKLVDDPPPNKQPKVEGTMTARVVNNVDPQGLSRVQVAFPDLSDANLSCWARMITPMAGADAGFFFLPDVGDEVAVTFEQGDINKPIISGAVRNGKERPPVTNTVANTMKKIKTKSGHTIAFDDMPGSGGITIESADGTKISVGTNGEIAITATKIKINGDTKKAARVTDKIEVELDPNIPIVNTQDGKPLPNIKLNGVITGGSESVFIGG